MTEEQQERQPEQPEPVTEPTEEPSEQHQGPLDNPTDAQYLDPDDPRRAEAERERKDEAAGGTPT